LNQQPSTKYLVVVGGPTASGKTHVGIEIAKHFKTEIISADSRQFYKELNIGVAKPSGEELEAIPHHFIGHRSIHDYYSAGEFERDVMSKLDLLFKKHDTVVMVGGSGLFINAVLHGFHPAPKDDGSIRKEIETLYNTQGVSALVEKLEILDPENVNAIDKQNPQRLMRAIERVMLTGKTQAEQTKPARAKRPFSIIEIAIDHPRSVLYERVNKRVDQMIQQGLLDEVKDLAPFKHLNALHAVGYSELFEHLEGEVSLETAIEKIKQNTRRYAKRQVTWFKNKSESKWFAPDSFDDIVDFVEKNR
jgi:tRNA dimethylallyltransferase